MNSLLSVLAVFSTLGGIILLWLLLRTLFSKPVSAITALLIMLGTNYFRWIFFDGHSPHNFLFTLHAALLYLALKWKDDPRWRWLWPMLPVALGACFLHDLSLLILALPLLFGIHDKTSWNLTRLRIVCNPLQYGYLLLILLLSFTLTRFSWFTAPGNTYYFGDPNGAVYPWIAANSYLILFSFNKGWLIYTPMVLLALPGMYLLAERNRGIFYGVFLFLVAWFLLSASNSAWNSGTGFGQRFFIETYPILALPLGYLVQWILERRMPVRMALLLTPLLFLLLNLFQTWQYTVKILPHGYSNRKHYFATFLATRYDASWKNLLARSWQEVEEHIPSGSDYQVTVLERWSFDTVIPGYQPFLTTRLFHSGSGSWRLGKDKPYSIGLTRAVRSVTTADSAWIRLTAWFYFEGHPDENWVNVVFTCIHEGRPYKYVVRNLTGSIPPRTWTRVSYDYQLPLPLLSQQDTVQAYFWNTGNQECFLDDYTFEVLEPIPNR